MDRNYNVIIFISKSRKPRVTIFTDTIKIVTMFIKIIFNMQSTYVSFDAAKSADFRWNSADASRTQEMCHVINITVLYLMINIPRD